MVTVSIDDKNIVENVKSIQELAKSGMYTDKELQEMYDKQVIADMGKETE